MFKLSICSGVYFSEIYLNTNLELTDLGGVDYEWVVADNTDHALPKLVDVSLDPRFKVIHGIGRDLELADGCAAIGQLQHALALNKCLLSVDKPDFILLLDPDFYVIPPIRSILDYMDRNEVLLFGSPYMSKTPLIPDYPVAFNLFIDTRKIPIGSLDFTPGYGDYPSDKYYPDCGYKVYSEHIKRKTKFEATMPSAGHKEKVAYTHTNRSLADYGITYKNERNAKGTKIDEYFWKDKPFGVHLRAKLNQPRNFLVSRVEEQMATIRHIFSKLDRS